ncbi:unnamed protein product [Nippostrongylus brasiliensis]|uniref:SCP domain-containing protein n=1 Tax=Nippostrongylus brasiliensis TaxID=27835 RepID=A0A0N4YYE5_NIPBR|nr:unnamed protein product [Nippostrongylus brasiliensis]
MNDFGSGFQCHDKIREFCNMAYPTNTRLGCAYERCGSDLLISCVYEQGQQVPFKPLLQLAPHTCVCNYYPNSVCDEDTSCGHLNNKMTDEVRQVFLDTHNEWRSLVARGKAEDPAATGGFAPKASQMTKLWYDCELEESAKQVADKCENTHIKGNYGENLFAASFSGYDQDEVAKMAVDQWAGELKKFGVGNNLIYPTPGLTGHYTQVVWQNTTRVGCYINDKCFPDSPGWKTQVVCRYKPTGNVLGREVYSKGEPCKKDSDCACYQCSCLADEGLCYDPNSMTK